MPNLEALESTTATIRRYARQFLVFFSLVLNVDGLMQAAEPVPIRLFRSTGLADWTAQTNAGVVGWESPVWRTGFDWDEAVPSWNVAPGSAWSVELRAVRGTNAGRWFGFGHWCSRTNRAGRTSLNEPADPEGRVLTDTLRLTEVAGAVQARLTAGAGATAAACRHFAVTLIDRRKRWPEPEPFRPAWGAAIPVPVRSQADFPAGVNSWCSPTSVTMLLAWWSESRHLLTAVPSVPEVAAGVFDPGWPGTGNWAFNMAFAGQTDGLHSMVARLAGVADLERWVAHGCPVAVSVSYALLKGRPAAERGDGHLVVVRGFSATGDVLINDPGVPSSRVQKTIPRTAFVAAWMQSQRTAYLVWPADLPPPSGGAGCW